MMDPKTTPVLLPADALLRTLSEHSGVQVTTVRKVLAALDATVGDVLFAGHAVRLPGLGTFEPRDVPAREGNMGGKTWSKPAGRKVVFKPLKALRDRLSKG